MTIEFVLNGTTHRVEPRPDESFLETLRERCGITSLKDGCSPQGQCGCCVALVDGLPKTTCAMPARVADGKRIVTLDGLPAAERQQIADCFAAAAGLQCGFCIPGIALRAKSITDRDPAPTREAIARALDVHLCRCTGYVKIIDAIELLAAAKRGAPIPPACTDGRVGQPLARVAAAQTALGDRPFVDDLAVPGMLHGALDAVAASARARAAHRHHAGPRPARRARGRDRRRRSRRALVRPAPQRLAGLRGRRRGGALRRRRARGRRGGRPPHGARGGEAGRSELRAAAAGARPAAGARRGRAARQPAAREPARALRHPARRRRRRACGERARGERHLDHAAHRASLPRARERARRAAPRRPPAPALAGPGHLRRSAAGGALPRRERGADLRRARAQRRRVRRQGGHVGPGPDRAARAPDRRAGEADAEPRGVDPPPPEAPPADDGLHGRLRRRGPAHRRQGAHDRRLRRLRVGRRQGARARGGPRLRRLSRAQRRRRVARRLHQQPAVRRDARLRRQPGALRDGGCVDLLAQKAGLDRWEIRWRNALERRRHLQHRPGAGEVGRHPQDARRR